MRQKTFQEQGGDAHLFTILFVSVGGLVKEEEEEQETDDLQHRSFTFHSSEL